MKNIKNKSIILALGILAILAFILMSSPNNASAQTGNNGWRVIDGGYNSNPTNPKPAINTINPSSSNVGVGTKTITVTGSGFVPGSAARVNGSNRPTTFIDSQHLLVQITGNDTYNYRTNGGFFITVFNGAPGGGYSNASFFTVNYTGADSMANPNNGNAYNGTTNFNDMGNSNYNNNYQSNNDTFVDTLPVGDAPANDGLNSYNNLASSTIFGSNSFLPSGLIQWVLFAIIILLIIILARKIFGATDNYHATPLKHD